MMRISRKCRPSSFGGNSDFRLIHYPLHLCLKSTNLQPGSSLLVDDEAEMISVTAPEPRDAELIFHLVARLAKDDPERIFCVQPMEQDQTKDLAWKNITFEAFRRASVYMAEWLMASVSTVSQPEVLAYIGPNDDRLVAFVLACIQTGNEASLEVRCAITKAKLTCFP